MEQAHRGRSAGIPLGRALAVPTGIANDELHEVIAVINRVHGDGDLPIIPLSFVRDLRGPEGSSLDGLFVVHLDEDGVLPPRSIRIRIGAPHRQWVTLHEIGHFVDASGLPGVGFSSETDAALAEWRQAVAQSLAHHDLERLAGDPDVTTAARARELLRPEELWARSYAQFVALRSRSASLDASLDALRRRRPGGVYFPRQWDDDDFAEIAAIIDALFRRLGWIA